VRGAIVALVYLFVLLYPFLSNKQALELWGIADELAWFDYIVTVVETVREAVTWLINPT